jgi:hypothetical protein
MKQYVTAKPKVAFRQFALDNIELYESSPFVPKVLIISIYQFADDIAASIFNAATIDPAKPVKVAARGVEDTFDLEAIK